MKSLWRARTYVSAQLSANNEIINSSRLAKRWRKKRIEVRNSTERKSSFKRINEVEEKTFFWMQQISARDVSPRNSRTKPKRCESWMCSLCAKWIVPARISFLRHELEFRIEDGKNGGSVQQQLFSMWIEEEPLAAEQHKTAQHPYSVQPNIAQQRVLNNLSFGSNLEWFCAIRDLMCVSWSSAEQTRPWYAQLSPHVRTRNINAINTILPGLDDEQVHEYHKKNNVKMHVRCVHNFLLSHCARAPVRPTRLQPLIN